MAAVAQPPTEEELRNRPISQRHVYHIQIGPDPPILYRRYIWGRQCEYKDTLLAEEPEILKWILSVTQMFSLPRTVFDSSYIHQIHIVLLQ